jgi:hypothetical protein
MDLLPRRQSRWRLVVLLILALACIAAGVGGSLIGYRYFLM